MANGADAQRELHEITGALDVLFTLREEFAPWLEEAQSEERKEELENVFRHVAAMEVEFQRRREQAAQKLAGADRFAWRQARRPRAVSASITPASVMAWPALSRISSRHLSPQASLSA